MDGSSRDELNNNIIDGAIVGLGVDTARQSHRQPAMVDRQQSSSLRLVSMAPVSMQLPNRWGRMREADSLITITKEYINGTKNIVQEKFETGIPIEALENIQKYDGRGRLF